MLENKLPEDPVVITARQLFAGERGDNMTEPVVEVPKHAQVSRGTSPGAWVEAWIWVPDPPAEEKA